MEPPDENRHKDPARPLFPPYLATPHTAPPQLPPETYTYLIHALLSLQSSAYPTSASPYPIPPNYSYSWPYDSAPPFSIPSVAGPSSTNPPISLPPHVAQPDTSSSQLTPSLAASPTTASAAEDLEEMEDATSTAEDKRRRNTAASARFRIKKKLKTLNLERAVTDLTGRTEELEREANDLRRENTWLKEIILLKGRNIGALNLGSQAPAAASGNRYEEEKDDRTQAGSEAESTVKQGTKGKDKEV